MNPPPSLSRRPRPDPAAAPPGTGPDAGQGHAPGNGRTIARSSLLDARYEHLRHAALHERANAFPLGLAVLIGKGVATWLTVLTELIGPLRRAPARAPAHVPVSGSLDRSPALPADLTSELVNILAAMTLIPP
ncbi:hypothetical protein [Nonomuraea sp. NPDC049400]|uniref:hypothetical protein n=1 Tax=Nonomuraea sp. NPDC049400 TaxID=3364352 RepID=UPI0037B7309E